MPPPPSQFSLYHTLEADSKFAISQEEIKALDNKRPLGISGHLRVKNEPDTITLSILSVLPALDELIITCQPYINKSNQDETYLQCKQLAQKYPHKIKLYYYLPDVVAVENSHISNHTPEIQAILKKYNHQIPQNSIHNIAHYYNYGLVRIKYKYYVKIDADHFYLTNKLLEFRKDLLLVDSLLKSQRNWIDKLIGKGFTYFYAPLSRELSFKRFIALCYLINKRCAFSLSGLNLGSKNYKNTFSTELQRDFYPLRNYQDLYIPLNPQIHSNFKIFNGSDHIVAPITSKNLYHCAPSGFEYMQMTNLKHILTLGAFSFHYGMKKRGVKILGKENEDFISLQNFINTPVSLIAKRAIFKGNTYYDLRHQKENLKYWKDKDSRYIRDFFKDYLKTNI